jgi:xylulokinase
MYRSILEGIALELRLQLEGVKLAVGKANDDLVVLGGGSRSDLWCQILADVLGHPIRRCQSANAPALGAAVLASVAHGVYPSFERATDAMTRLSTSFEPKDKQRYYDRVYRDVYRGLYVDLRSRIGALAELRDLISPGGETMAPPPPLSDADAS